MSVVDRRESITSAPVADADSDDVKPRFRCLLLFSERAPSPDVDLLSSSGLWSVDKMGSSPVGETSKILREKDRERQKETEREKVVRKRVCVCNKEEIRDGTIEATVNQKGP